MNKTQQARKDRLMPDGKPRYIRAYDNQTVADRYTVVYTRTGRSGSNRQKPKSVRSNPHIYVGMSDHPFHPQGFGQHGESTTPIDTPSYGHLGKKITFEDLPDDCKKLVLNDYVDIWNLK